MKNFDCLPSLKYIIYITSVFYNVAFFSVSIPSPAKRSEIMLKNIIENNLDDDTETNVIVAEKTVESISDICGSLEGPGKEVADLNAKGLGIVTFLYQTGELSHTCFAWI